MSWTPDKQRHYTACYNATNLIIVITTFPVRLIIAVSVWFFFSFCKEVIWDKILGKGLPELTDTKANLIGCLDAVVGKQKRF